MQPNETATPHTRGFAVVLGSTNGERVFTSYGNSSGFVRRVTGGLTALLTVFGIGFLLGRLARRLFR